MFSFSFALTEADRSQSSSSINEDVKEEYVFLVLDCSVLSIMLLLFDLGSSRFASFLHFISV